jgi:lysophospholipase L1-like esterase
VQTIEGPAARPAAKLEGGAVEPFPSPVIAVRAGASLTLKNLQESTGGGSGVTAVDDFGTLEIESSTLAGNDGSAVLVESGGSATVRNSTLSDGLDFGLIDNGSASFFNSTVAFNAAGGIENKNTLNLTNTIVAENKGSGDCAGKAATSDHSLDSDGSCRVGAPLSNRNPLLGKLVNNGGATPTRALQQGSPAIDAADTAMCPSVDQRGFPRPDISKTACDVGAYEFQAPPSAEPPHKRYLALGDSVAFGYSQELFNENFPTESPAAFEEALPVGSGKPNGYVLDYFLKLVNSNQRWQADINNGCPGETTDGLIGNGKLRKQLEERGLIAPPPTGSWIESTVNTEPCAYTYKNGLELHHPYARGGSQLENALEVLQKENTGSQATKHPVQLVTLNIGANDIIRGIGKCEAEVKAEYEKTGDSKYNHAPYFEPGTGKTPQDATNGCAKGHVGEIFHHVFMNEIATIFAIEEGGALGLCTGKTAPCAASEVAVNFPYQVTMLGSYNPYGSVFEETTKKCQGEISPAACNHEILEGSNVLDAVLNIDENSIMTEVVPHGCFANPQPAFNPSIFPVNKTQNEWGEGALGSLVSTGHGGKFNEATKTLEPDPSPFGTLQKWTNMANFSTAKNPAAAADQYKGKNGPGDIHPTAAGYEELANTIQEQCPS